jgi:hypothetical protein
LYVKVAELHHLQDMERDERIAYIESVLNQLTFELKSKE